MPIVCRSLLARLAGLVLFFAILSGSSSAQLPPVTVDKVEPPGWRSGPPAEVMLSLSGMNLDRVVGVTVKHKGLRVLRIQSPDAKHLLVFLRIAPDAEPGTAMLQLSTRFTTTFTALPMFDEHPPSGAELAGK